MSFTITGGAGELEEHQAHVVQSRAERKGTAWCGARIEFFMWHFGNIDHAADSARSRMQPCPACVDAIVKALRQEEI